MGVARNIVRSVLRSSGPPSYQRQAKGSIVDAVEPEILKLLRDCPGRRFEDVADFNRQLTGTVSADPAPYAEALTTLGFALSPVAVHLGRDYTLGWLDFGPESVDGWLARLAAAELGVKPEGLLDTANRELVLEDGRVALTTLEFGVFQCLLAHKGKAVSRAMLIEHAWGHTYTGGSNVVDVVVRSLRKKMGPTGSAIETVRGVGYRLSA